MLERRTIMFRRQPDERVEFELNRLQVAVGLIYNHSLGEFDAAELSRRLAALGLPSDIDAELLAFLAGVYMGVGWTAGVFVTYRRSGGPWFKQE
jgi:hypothetical protein